MSSGPSLLMENPRAAVSNCMDDAPRSNRTASTLLAVIPWVASRLWTSLKRPWRAVTCELVITETV